MGKKYDKSKQDSIEYNKDTVLNTVKAKDYQEFLEASSSQSSKDV